MEIPRAKPRLHLPHLRRLERSPRRNNWGKTFAGQNYILVTVDFPHQKILADNVRRQNASLGQKFDIHSYPTLIVLDATGKELGRQVGYNPGSGPDAVIATLKGFTQN